jgi:hypothetical protein
LYDAGITCTEKADLMDKRSWPWKKKPSDKITAYSENLEPSSNHPDGQVW